jgi:hypothetical protein
MIEIAAALAAGALAGVVFGIGAVRLLTLAFRR